MARTVLEATMATLGNSAWVCGMAAGAFALAIGGERILGLALG